MSGWLLQTVKWMTYPVLAYGMLVGLLFTAEGLVMRIPAALHRRGEQLLVLAGNVRPAAAAKVGLLTGGLRQSLGQLVHKIRPQPATQAVGRGKSAAPLKINAPRKPAPAGGESTRVSSPAVPLEPVGGPGVESSSVATLDEDVPETLEESDIDDGSADGSRVAPPAVGVDLEDDDDGPPLPEPPPRREVVVNMPAPPKPGTVPVTAPARPYPAALGAWELPELSMLAEPEYNFSSQQEAVVREKAALLERALQEYRVEAQVVEIDTGPVITMFELQVAAGVKVSQIASLANDLARSLKAPNVRVVAPIPGKNTIGIEVPNTHKEKVRIKELMTLSEVDTRKMALPLFLGKDASGKALVEDLARMPHMLIAGTTGSGKSVCMNSVIVSLLMTQRPDIVKLILVDPKMVEMSMFRDVPHLMCPIVTEMDRAEKILEWATIKMDERYALLAEAGVRNIAAYNRMSMEEKLERFQPSNEEEKAQIPAHLPYVVIMIDELADMMMLSAKEVELHLSRLAQKSRAVGIHIIVATQRPEARIVTGLIKSNLPCRVAFRVASRMDSRIVLDQNGAEVLMGSGDMLYLPPGSAKLVRAQGTFLEDAELKNVLDFLREHGKPEFHPELMQLGRAELSSDGPRDELFDRAVEVVLETRRGSVSLLQRRLTIGYSRASRLIDEMAVAGIVGEYKGSQAREVTLTPDEWQAMKEQEASRLRSAALSGDGVEDMLYDDDI